jgi:hypothetical protein
VPAAEAAIVRIKRVQGTPETVELGRRFFRDVVRSCCSEVPGFRTGWFLVDHEHSRTVTLTVWADRSSLDAAIRNLVARVESDSEAAAKVDRINAGGVEFETYAVSESFGPGPGRSAGFEAGLRSARGSESDD